MATTTTIPSPTPITGVLTPGGKPGMRLPISQLQQQHPFAFALYVQALAAWQNAGSDKVDPDNVNGTSYFQVVGVHGVPFVPWQNDPSAVQIPEIGYCTHRSVLFMPWHRPYLMLYEQIIYAYAQTIAGQATGYAASAYAEALGNIRLPYWDWATDPHLPAIVMQPDITLTIPGKSPGTTDALHLDHNPLYSYKFTSEYAVNTLQTELNWDKTPAWAESKRCPEADGTSNQEISNVQVGTFREFKWQTFELLTTVSSFDEFTCQAWKEGLAPQSFNSIESMHNNVHNYTGTNDVVMYDDNTKRLGNMTDVQASSFDPIFWLHHVNCDRLTALWQALNTDVTIETIPSLTDRYNAKAGTVENGESSLEPWHKTAHPSMKDYYIANDVKELNSTFEYGYYYPETPLSLFGDPVRMKAFVTGQIYALYGPPKPKPHAPAAKMPAVHNNPTNGAPAENGDQPGGDNGEAAPLPHHTLPVPIHNPLSSLKATHWQVFLRVKNFALTGTWAVHIFFGDPPPEEKDWLLSDTRALDEILVTGQVPLNDSLREKGIDVEDTEGVVAYLKENLKWRVVKDTQNVDITPDMNLTVGVSAREIEYPSTTDKLPTWGESQIYPAATAGQTGGLQDAKEDLGLEG
ncbi:common central domain of tyrosinase-domain-containing protein [Xylariales sp. PMI_506]|nr:common central domain of tyrosinase-domain-containing protein [Xylariales sp. PMI_506]